MDFNLDKRSASLSVGEFSDFTTGPHDAGGGGSQGRWRAQLGTHWHNELRARAASDTPAATFEVPIAGQIFHRGWTLTFTGRIDQLLREDAVVTIREIKTVTRPLPADEAELRADYPAYFVQLATYVALRRLASSPEKLRGELVFVETSSGLAQTVPLARADDAVFRGQLERVAEFLDLRLRARERLRHLAFRPPFASPRPGQETTRTELTAAFERHPLVLFEAPTGFGKTGVLLEFALDQLRAGHFDRALYLTSKSTGQLQVVRTLAAMTTPPEPAPAPNAGAPAAELASSAAPAMPVAVWHVRNKAEHCINPTFHCVRENCGYLDRLEARWPASGLARFYRFENQPRDLDTLRAAGREARICPYEITRAALAFNDVWIGDYNYVFAPANRSLFYSQPGFDPARTLLILDEAHNLPSRVADAHSHTLRADDARALLAELDHLRAPAALQRAWESWALLLGALLPVESLDPALEADVADTLAQIADQLGTVPLDYAALGPRFSELLWQTQPLSDWLVDPSLKKLLWCPHPGELAFTCIDAADAIGATLREFGGVVAASATFGPGREFAESCGLVPAPSAPPSAQSAASSGSASAASAAPAPVQLHAATPWRDGAYDVAVDARVDTTFHHRARHYATTAATVAALHVAASAAQTSPSSHSPAPNAAARCVAVFFPSYAYAGTIARELERLAPLRVALQPHLRDLAAQTAWVEESLVFADAVFLVLGSSFAESIDLLGGRVTHAMVVGPALPEVNPVQRARLAEFAPLGREAAFRRVYQIPGMTKVNQALGRLVRAPGQRARVLLHCRRFLDPGYASLLATDYQFGANLLDDADLAAWLERPAVVPAS
jgi:Rad3-related DNA helicase